jgi:hypothetical protein
MGSYASQSCSVSNIVHYRHSSVTSAVAVRDTDCSCSFTVPEDSNISTGGTGRENLKDSNSTPVQVETTKYGDILSPSGIN